MKNFDALTKQYISDNERFADLFNYFVFHGKQVLTPEGLEERGVTEVAIPYIGKEYKTVQKVRDILKACVAKEADDVVYVLFGLESQSSIHYAMPVRNMLYDAMNFSAQVETLTKKNRQDKALKGSAEYLSGLRKDDRLVPVVTLTLYWGTEKWDGPRSLREMLEDTEPEILKLVPDYRMHLVSPAEMDEASLNLLHTELNQVFGGIKAAADGVQALKKLEKEPAYRALSAESAKVLSAAIGLDIDIPEGGTVNMCKALEEYARENKKEGREEGRAEGREEGRAEGHMEAIAESISALVETLKIGIDQAMDYLKVAPEYREEYKKLLKK